MFRPGCVTQYVHVKERCVVSDGDGDTSFSRHATHDAPKSTTQRSHLHGHLLVYPHVRRRPVLLPGGALFGTLRCHFRFGRAGLVFIRLQHQFDEVNPIRLQEKQENGPVEMLVMVRPRFLIPTDMSQFKPTQTDRVRAIRQAAYLIVAKPPVPRHETPTNRALPSKPAPLCTCISCPTLPCNSPLCKTACTNFQLNPTQPSRAQSCPTLAPPCPAPRTLVSMRLRRISLAVSRNHCRVWKTGS